MTTSCPEALQRIAERGRANGLNEERCGLHPIVVRGKSLILATDGHLLVLVPGTCPKRSPVDWGASAFWKAPARSPYWTGNIADLHPSLPRADRLPAMLSDDRIFAFGGEFDRRLLADAASIFPQSAYVKAWRAHDSAESAVLIRGRGCLAAVMPLRPSAHFSWRKVAA